MTVNRRRVARTRILLQRLQFHCNMPLFSLRNRLGFCQNKAMQYVRMSAGARNVSGPSPKGHHEKNIEALALSTIVLGVIHWGVAAHAQTAPSTMHASTNTTSSSPTAGQLADSYAATIGSKDEARSVVEAMRTGSDVTVGETTVSGSGKTMGWGNVNIALSLAGSQVAPGASSKDFLSALNNVMGMRSSGMGWGQVAKELGVNIGQVVSASRSSKAKAEVASSTSKSTGKSSGLSQHAVAGSAAGRGQSGDQGGGNNKGSGGNGAGGGGGGNGGGKN